MRNYNNVLTQTLNIFFLRQNNPYMLSSVYPNRPSLMMNTRWRRQASTPRTRRSYVCPSLLLWSNSCSLCPRPRYNGTCQGRSLCLHSHRRVSKSRLCCVRVAHVNFKLGVVVLNDSHWQHLKHIFGLF